MLNSKHIVLLFCALAIVLGPGTAQNQSQPDYIYLNGPENDQSGVPDNSTGETPEDGIAAGFPECAPVYTFLGEGPEDQFGIYVSSAGDVNGDGYDDLIVGALLNDAGGINSGRAYVFCGLTGDTLFVFTGEASGDALGWPVASAGDINSDGFDDVIIGAYYNDAAGIDAGRAYVLSGHTGDTLHVFTGEAADDMLGWAITSAGDVDGDGVPDLIVGAPQNNGGGWYRGRVYVYSGQSGDTLHVFNGEFDVDVLGTAVASPGDVDNDGYADLIMSAYLYGTPDTGRVYVFSGLTKDTIHVFSGEADNDRFGWAVAKAGDVNNDGTGDVIIGAPQNDAGGFNAGRVYVFSGNTGDTLHVFTGEAADDRLGWSCASAGDVNNDGYHDLIVGAYGSNAGGISSGRAYVFSGRTGDTLYIFTGGPGSAWRGAAVASAGDINNDGYDDLFVGSPGYDYPFSNRGRADVFLGGWICGDANGDLAVTIDDVMLLQDYYFDYGASFCPWRASDLNCDGNVDIADIIYLAQFVYNSGPAPCCWQ